MKQCLNRISLAAFLATAAAGASALPTAFVGADLSQIVLSHYGTTFSTEMLGLNNLGQVLGRTSTRDATLSDTSHTFLIANGALTEIGAFDTSRGTGTGIFGRGLNNLGDVVGEIYVAGTGAQRLRTPALYSGGSVTRLNLPFTSGSAVAISDTGHIAGWRLGSGTLTDARNANFVLRSDGSYAEFLQGRFGDIAGINPAGTVVGSDNLLGRGSLGYVFNGTLLAYPLQPGNPQDAENGNFEVKFSAVNDAGHIATTWRTYAGQSCYYTPEGDVCSDLHNREAGVIGALGFAPAPDLNSQGSQQQYVYSRATGINNRGTLIGHDDIRGAAFLSDGTTTVTLNDPRRIASSNFYGELYDINDADQLLGRDGNSGSSHWVLLNPVGANAQAPLLPAEQTSTADGGTAFTFTVFAAPATRLFFDPPVAVGYEYELQSGPSFASVLLPNVGDGKYRLELWNGTAWVDAGVELVAGVSFDFLAGVSADGVRKFRIVGIEIDVALDPTDPNAFVTGLTFIGSGELKLTQTSLTVDVPAVPEPKTYAMLLLGLGVVLVGQWRRRPSWCTVGPG